MPEPLAIDVQDVDHLGIIAGIVDEIGPVEIVNEQWGTHEQECISAGNVVKALILNCLGFLTAPLYLFSQFFEGKATKHLIGAEVKPEHLNDHRIGRVLDRLYSYSRDSRPDLKQFTLNLICSGDADVPLSLGVGNGNHAERAVFPALIQQFQQQWTGEQPKVFVADAALFSEENLRALETTPWITRAPATLAAVQQLLQTLPAEQFQASGLSGYAIAEVCSTYADVRQRWLVVHSQARQTSDLKQLGKRIAKQLTKHTQALGNLGAHPFACEASISQEASLDRLHGRIAPISSIPDLKH